MLLEMADMRYMLAKEIKEQTELSDRLEGSKYGSDIYLPERWTFEVEAAIKRNIIMSEEEEEDGRPCVLCSLRKVQVINSSREGVICGVSAASVCLLTP